MPCVSDHADLTNPLILICRVASLDLTRFRKCCSRLYVGATGSWQIQIGGEHISRRSRTHSLFRQGCMLYELIPNMPEHRLKPLMQTFAEAVTGTGLFQAAIAASK